tara:strand:- start:287 stop:466 length:180 start_codon:yes stop_codon:yes gene_type:complete
MKVTWDEKTCIHAGECVKNLPTVFKIVDKKFVIDEGAATEDKIKEVVGLCPSAALKIKD